ncbi:Uncharacterized protein HZ326_11684 [Fusarium oxysporum f. sp. albedinis]|nr:Uncharacterized protein HZ326_11684 [Fusarium oxysporum f. sp. albedinis]
MSRNKEPRFKSRPSLIATLLSSAPEIYPRPTVGPLSSTTYEKPPLYFSLDENSTSIVSTCFFVLAPILQTISLNLSHLVETLIPCHRMGNSTRAKCHTYAVQILASRPPSKSID